MYGRMHKNRVIEWKNQLKDVRKTERIIRINEGMNRIIGKQEGRRKEWMEERKYERRIKKNRKESRINRWMIGKTEESMGGRKNECMGERKEE